MTLTRPGLAIAGVIGLVALSGCGGGGVNPSAGSAAAAPIAAGRAADSNLGNTGNAHSPAYSVKGGGAGEIVTKSVIKQGDIQVHTSDPQVARDKVDALLIRLNGTIDDEQTVYDTHGQIKESHLILRVPVATFDSAMNDLERLGTVVHSSSTGKDVTNQVIDVQQRLQTLRISLRDLNSFQRRAANIDQLLRFENAITERRGEYQSLKAQRNHLVNETSMSTITLDISVPPVHAVVKHHHRGFLTGLHHGWSAFTRTVLVTLTAVGAALPFAVLLVLVGLPLWWWSRRGSRGTLAPTPATPAETPPAD